MICGGLGIAVGTGSGFGSGLGSGFANGVVAGICADEIVMAKLGTLIQSTVVSRTRYVNFNVLILIYPRLKNVRFDTSWLVEIWNTMKIINFPCNRTK